jgi:hypothetical protein
VAGYSGRALADKLGVGGNGIVLLGAPDGFESNLPGARTSRRLGRATDTALLFVTRRADLERRWERVTSAMTPAGAVCVAWPKKASGVATDMTENVVREVVLPSGWVDTKVCAVDEIWSGLKCVLRVALRPQK